jgi:taurine dioxygenase
MESTRFAAPLGARIEGIDLRKVTDAEWAEINEKFLAHQVLVFPNQDLTESEHIAFAQRWGKLVRHPYAGMKDFPDIIELRNVGKRRDINQHWHSDMTYNKTPPKFTMLYAKETPSIGGDTAFSNQILAYNALSEGLKNVLADLKAVHTAANLATQYKQNTDEAPSATHPVVRTHDETQQQALFVCRAFTSKFVGWSTRESQSLLTFLYEHSIRPEFQARHQWQDGDIVMWDNRSILHYAVHDHADNEPRTIRRLQVEGSVPV